MYMLAKPPSIQVERYFFSISENAFISFFASTSGSAPQALHIQ